MRGTPSTTFEVHVNLLGADCWGLENIRNHSTIPPRGTELFVGLQNYVDILGNFDVAKRTAEGWVINYQNFYWTLFITICWTVSNVALGVGLGMILALALNTPGLKFKAVYRVLLILPWAIPNYITALIWQALFHQQFGAINQAIQMFGGEPVAARARHGRGWITNIRQGGRPEAVPAAGELARLAVAASDTVRRGDAVRDARHIVVARGAARERAAGRRRLQPAARAPVRARAGDRRLRRRSRRTSRPLASAVARSARAFPCPAAPRTAAPAGPSASPAPAGTTPRAPCPSARTRPHRWYTRRDGPSRGGGRTRGLTWPGE